MATATTKQTKRERVQAFKPARRSAASPSPGTTDRPRCRWAEGDALLAAYHDDEWGRSIQTDDGHLERMALEIFQCGLSWRLVLQKREALRDAFEGFRIADVAGLTARDVARLMLNPGIIRNRRKIDATIRNAAAFARLAAEHGSYRRWLGGIPLATPGQRRAAFKLFRETFAFMGPETTKCYLWGTGMVAPPHERHCWIARRDATPASKRRRPNHGAS